ncbi:MAG: hypothetical protein Q9162_003851 [Coniocarpon cinnabarinum]
MSHVLTDGTPHRNLRKHPLYVSGDENHSNVANIAHGERPPSDRDSRSTTSTRRDYQTESGYTSAYGSSEGNGNGNGNGNGSNGGNGGNGGNGNPQIESSKRRRDLASSGGGRSNR